jgi:outer membrane lipoprotein-sorting protein
MKIICTFVLYFACALALSAQSAFNPVSSANDVLGKMQKASSLLLALESDFTQTKYLDMLDESIASKGKFFYKKAGMICLDYHTPVGYQVVFNKEKMKVTSDGKASVYDVKKNKMMMQMNHLMIACLTGHLNMLTSEYCLAVKENKSQYWVELQSLAGEESSIKSLDIFMDKKYFSVQQLRIVETSNDRTIYEFTGSKKNISIPDAKFNIEQ